jgi:TRAP-type C4-dicarboxylate transport system substrate-binding protein
MVGMGMAPLVGGLVMTKAAWAKLPEADRAKVQAACDRMEKRLEVEVPRQDTTAVGEMRKRGLTVNTVSPAHAAEFRSVAEDFATALAGIRIPPDVLALARKERDAFRKSNGVGK